MPISAPRLQQFDMTDYINALLTSRRNVTNDNYGRARTDLSGKAAQSRQAIGQSYADFQGATGRTGADYNQESARINASIAQANRGAEQAITQQNAGLQADLRNQGADTTALNAGMANQQAAAANQGTLEAALAQRLQQVAGQQARDTADSGAMVRQGAEGTLANNESDVLAKILSQQNAELGDIETQGQGLYMENQKSMADQMRAQQAMDFEAQKFNASEAAQANRDAMQARLQQMAADKASPNADLQRALMEKELNAGKRNEAGLKDSIARDFAHSSGDIVGARGLVEAYLNEHKDWGEVRSNEFRQRIGSQLASYFLNEGQGQALPDRSGVNRMESYFARTRAAAPSYGPFENIDWGGAPEQIGRGWDRIASKLPFLD